MSTPEDEAVDGTSAEFLEVWNFIEKKMKVDIPPFLKYVLKFCGYDNHYTIAGIEDNDFEYFESQVRNGGIVEFYRGKISENELWKGSMKGVADFEILRGHRKLLIAVVEMVKKRLVEYGPANFYDASPNRKKKMKVSGEGGKPSKNNVENISRQVPRKKIKFSSAELLRESVRKRE